MVDCSCFRAPVLTLLSLALLLSCHLMEKERPAEPSGPVSACRISDSLFIWGGGAGET